MWNAGDGEVQPLKVQKATISGDLTKELPYINQSINQSIKKTESSDEDQKELSCSLSSPPDMSMDTHDPLSISIYYKVNIEFTQESINQSMCR
jgi:hypothetical protein